MNRPRLGVGGAIGPDAQKMQAERDKASRRWGIAWIGLCSALALHVADEALTGFLPVYNELIESVRETTPWFPFPTLTFPVWISGLIVLVLVLFALSPLVFRGNRWLRPVAYLLGTIMVANAMGHMAASVYWHTWAPGVYSSPLLLVAAIALLVATRRAGSAAHRAESASGAITD